MAKEGLSFKSVLAIALLMLIIAASTSYGFMRFFMLSNSEKVREVTIGPTYSLGDFVVNLTGSRGYQYVQASIVVEVSTDNVIDELEKRSPQIRDCIIAILRDQTVADIEEPDAQTIKNRIMASLNSLLYTGQITQVWFTQLVVQ
ncbi:MAG: flagellar basal body-associated protein FliL [Halanaerobiaceae bacterium]|nr:flagellar basal body-associated protein FliL [Halanaerobiaceae bacterium]